jgi:putative transposase
VGTAKFPVGIIPYVAHRAHPVPSSIHIAVERGQWGLSFAAEDAAIARPAKTVDAMTEQIAENVRHLSVNQLAERTLGGDRGVAQPLVTSDGQVFNLTPVPIARIQKARRQQKRWQRRANRRKKGSRNQQTASRKVARYPRYEAHVRHEYAHQSSHRLVATDTIDLSVFEDLKISPLTTRPTAKRDPQGHFLPNGRNAKASLNRAILSSAWGPVVSFTPYNAVRHGKLVLTGPPQHRSQEGAICAVTSPDNRPSPSAFVCQRCGHPDHADRNAAVVMAKRGITTLLSGMPLPHPHKPTRIFRTLGPERSEVTPGEMSVRRLGQRPWRSDR